MYTYKYINIPKIEIKPSIQRYNIFKNYHLGQHMRFWYLSNRQTSLYKSGVQPGLSFLQKERESDWFTLNVFLLSSGCLFYAFSSLCQWLVCNYDISWSYTLIFRQKVDNLLHRIEVYACLKIDITLTISTLIAGSQFTCGQKNKYR